MEISIETRLAAAGGTQLIKGTTEVTGLSRYAFVPREDTTITSIKGTDSNGEEVNILALMGLTVSDVLKKDELWACSVNYVITKIKLASGSVRVY